jgi:hypothetical protein
MKRGLIIGAVLVSTAAIAQVGPSEIWGLIYNLVAPTLSDKQTTTWQSTSDGHLSVTGLGPPPNCTGAIDLSEGCTLTVMLRLGP